MGCEKHYFDVDYPETQIKFRLGSYVDVIYSNFELNFEPENLLRLAAPLVASLKGCNLWWSDIELELEMLKHLHGNRGAWGLMLVVGGYGRDQDEAEKFWNVSLDRLRSTISALPKDFPLADPNPACPDLPPPGPPEG